MTYCFLFTHVNPDEVKMLFPFTKSFHIYEFFFSNDTLAYVSSTLVIIHNQLNCLYNLLQFVVQQHSFFQIICFCHLLHMTYNLTDTTQNEKKLRCIRGPTHICLRTLTLIKHTVKNERSTAGIKFPSPTPPPPPPTVYKSC